MNQLMPIRGAAAPVPVLAAVAGERTSRRSRIPCCAYRTLRLRLESDS
jgi:hypothetical protein